jgi:ribonuclease HI
MSQNSLYAATDIVVHTDGGSRGNPGPAGIGVVIERNGEVLHEISECLGVKTNNEAEYEAFATSLKWILDHKEEIKPLQVTWKLDSMLVVQQLNRQWKIKEQRMLLFAQQIWQNLIDLGAAHIISYVPRAENKRADELVNIALDAQSTK